MKIREIAIAVREDDLYLIATVVRDDLTDVYVNWPRDKIPKWKPHTSYHESGQHHQKAFGKAFLARKRQRPNVNFKGTINIVSFGIATGEAKAVNVRCDPTKFDDAFEIRDDVLRQGKYSTYVYVDLVEPRAEPLLLPGGEVKQQQVFKDAEPWIVVTLLDYPQEGRVGIVSSHAGINA